MNSIASLFAAPSAAFDVTTQTVKAAATPFKLLLQAAQESQASASASQQEGDSGDEAASLQERIAQQLQSLLESLGVQPGDRASLSVNEAGEILADGHPLANEIESAVNAEPDLKAGIASLAESEALFDQSPFFGNGKLEVEITEGRNAALLNWY